MWIRERSGYESDEGGTIDYRLRTTHSAVGSLWSVVGSLFSSNEGLHKNYGLAAG